MRDTFGWLLFRVIGNSLKFPITQKGTNVPMMRTYALTENSLFSAFYSRGGIWCFAHFFLSAVLFLRRQKEYLFLFLPRLYEF